MRGTWFCYFNLRLMEHNDSRSFLDFVFAFTVLDFLDFLDFVQMKDFHHVSSYKWRIANCVVRIWILCINGIWNSCRLVNRMKTMFFSFSELIYSLELIWTWSLSNFFYLFLLKICSISEWVFMYTWSSYYIIGSPFIFLLFIWDQILHVYEFSVLLMFSILDYIFILFLNWHTIYLNRTLYDIPILCFIW